MENEKKRFVEQELNSDDYKKAVNGAKAVKEGGLIGSMVVGTFFIIRKHGPKLLKALSNLI